MNRWPWISFAAAFLVAVSPLGLSVLKGTFFSSEQLTRSISGFLFVTWVLVLVGLALIEWLVRCVIIHRRARAAATSADIREQAE
jgi:hypothetical protein